MNRAMVLTGSGSAAIAVVRVEGPAVELFLRDCFDRPAREGMCVHGRIRDGERILDDAVVVLHGTQADLNLHGGIWIVRGVLNLLARRGFQVHPWVPGELWGADGESPLEREIAAYLPLAQSELAISVLLNQRQAWKRINDGSTPHSELEKILADRTLELLLHPPSVAIVGLANVGKSTLANQLFGQERSITADMPGTTRDWVGELASIDGLVVKLIDTPGQRDADDAIEKHALAASEPLIDAAELVVMVFDPTQNAAVQKKMLARRPQAMVVINKADLGEWIGAGVRTTAVRGIGIDIVRHEIRRRFGVLDIDTNAPRCWTERQKEEIRRRIGAKRTDSN